MVSVAFNDYPSLSYGASPAILDHSVSWHSAQVNVPHFNPTQCIQTHRYCIVLYFSRFAYPER